MIIIGHRGARNEAPENTEVGFQHLRNLNIHHVELDVRLSKDKQLMVLHDTTVDRTTNKKGKVTSFTANELNSFNAGCRFKPKSRNITNLSYDSTTIPKLNDVIQAWPELESIQLEVKTTNKKDLSDIADRLNFLIDAHGIQQQAIITSSDTEMLRIVAQRYRHISRGFVAERFRRDPIGNCLNLGCRYLVIDWRRCSEALIQEAHDANLIVSVWTVNKIETAFNLYHWGADSIITDEPTQMLQAFRHLDISHSS